MSQPGDLVRPLLRVRQVREFTATPVDDASLDALTDAGRWSGSARNGQPWRFIVITDPERLRAMAQAGMPQTRSLATAPAAIAIAMPRDESASDVSQTYDEGRAAERILVAATLLGLGAGIAWVRSEVPAADGRADRPARRPLRANDRGGRSPDRGGFTSEVGSGRGTAPAERDGLPRALARLSHASGNPDPDPRLEVRSPGAVGTGVDDLHEIEVLVAGVAGVVRAARVGAGRIAVDGHGPAAPVPGPLP